MLNDPAGMGQAFGPASHASTLKHAAELRMQKIRAKPEDHAEQNGVLSQFLRLFMRTVLVASAGIGTAAAYYTYAYETQDLQTIVEETKKKEENKFVGSQLWVDAMEYYLKWRKSFETTVKDYTDPTYHKLLPDMAPELRGRIKTLVLDLDDVLVSKEWTRKKGWSIYKRPGVQEFIAEMGRYFEIVVFSDAPHMYVDPIIDRLDREKVIPYRLYRGETQYHNGKHVRDLSKLNRDLSQVLFISATPEAYQFQPENTIKLKAWKGDVHDTTLLDLIPMLQLIAKHNVRDVRDVVRSYDGEEDVAKAFKQRMQHVAETHKQPKQRGFLSLK